MGQQSQGNWTHSRCSEGHVRYQVKRPLNIQPAVLLQMVPRKRRGRVGAGVHGDSPSLQVWLKYTGMPGITIGPTHRVHSIWDI